MIEVRIFGGLGNQMFQYAVGRCLSKKIKTGLKLDISFYKSQEKREFVLNRFNISNDIVISDKKTLFNNKIVRKLMSLIKFPKCYYRNYSKSFDRKFVEIPDDSYIDGYFQNEKYFSEIEELLLKEFSPSFEVCNDFNFLKKRIGENNSVSIHVRRGDYLEKRNRKIHGILGIEYYKKAIELIKNEIKHPQFFVFSDDKMWCEKNILPLLDKAEIVNISSENKDVEELLLMSCCKHNIIANSSYSWWGAWLNTNNDAIIFVPKKWIYKKGIIKGVKSFCPIG